MIEKTLIIDTSSNYFCGWLINKLNEIDKKTFPSENGYYQLRKAECKKSSIATLKIVKLGGYYIYPKADDHQKGNLIDEIAIFKILELENKKIELTIICKFNAFKSFIDELIIDIQSRWSNKGSGKDDKKHIESKEKQKKHFNWPLILGIFTILVAIIICLATPFYEQFVDEWRKSKHTPVSTVTLTNDTPPINHFTNTPEILASLEPITATPYDIPTATATVAISTPATNITPTPNHTLENRITSTPQPTTTSVNHSTSIGMIDLGDNCWGDDHDARKDQELKEKLSSLGFNVEYVNLNSEHSVLMQYDVIYLPYGWYCQMDNIQIRAFYYQQYVEHGGGFLVGNPNISRERFNFNIFQSTITYRPNPHYSVDYPPEIIPDNSLKSIVENFFGYDMPVPENTITINRTDNNFVISRGRISKAYSLIIIDSNYDGRAVFLTGGELAENNHPISDDFWSRIIFWLSRKIN